MSPAEIFTQYAERKQIYQGVNIVLFANIIYLVISLILFMISLIRSYLVISLIRFCDIT